MSESNETKLPEPTLINLEGLKEAVLAYVPVRDELGYTRNPALPCTDEGVRFDTLLRAFGLDTLFVGFESQIDEDSPAQAEYEAGNGCASWMPVAPEGEGWQLAEVYDTEDGAYAMFVRETPPPLRVSRREARAAALSNPSQSTGDSVRVEGDAKDAARYRKVRRGQYWSVIDGMGDELKGEDLDGAIDYVIQCREESSARITLAQQASTGSRRGQS